MTSINKRLAEFRIFGAKDKKKRFKKLLSPGIRAASEIKKGLALGSSNVGDVIQDAGGLVSGGFKGLKYGLRHINDKGKKTRRKMLKESIQAGAGIGLYKSKAKRLLSKAKKKLN